MSEVRVVAAAVGPAKLEDLRWLRWKLEGGWNPPAGTLTREQRRKAIDTISKEISRRLEAAK
jgi:hypothetical protein